MAWAKPTQITAWSFSRYSQYKKCPLAAKFAFIDKIKQPQNDAMARGDAIHKIAEAYIKGTSPGKVPEELGHFPNFFKKMRQLYKKKPELITVEDTWAFRKDWSRTTWNDWAGCWVRIKLDLSWIDVTTVAIVDHKTGKFSPQYNVEEYMEQLDLYATGALLIYAHLGPDLKVIPALHFLDHEVIYPEPGSTGVRVYTPADLPRLKKEWEKRTKPMLNDKTFAPKPNSLCGWCYFGQAGKIKQGGPGLCKF